MNVNGINGLNAQAGQMGMNQAADSYSKNIQNQIANAQKQLQELSSNQDMTLEEKMKKQQEIQQKINDLNMQLRQHQIEQRKEKQQAKKASADDAFGANNAAGAKKAGNGGTGLSTAGMTAMISADGSIKRAKVQGSVASQMEGKANVLKAEIKQDAGRGVSVEKKKEELADMESRAQAAQTASMFTLADANKTVKDADKQDKRDNEKTTAAKNDEKEKAENSKSKAGEDAANKTAQVLSAEQQRVTYTPVDIRL